MKSEQAIRQMLGMLRAFNSTESAIKALAWVLDECPPEVAASDSNAPSVDGLAGDVPHRRGATEVEKSTSSSQEKNNA